MLERYSHPEMARVWSLENKLAKWLAVEIAVCEGWARRGVIPPAALDRIRQARVDPAAMARYEEETRHDVTAFLRALADAIGPDARFVHLGLTSSDVVDTALALQVQEASAILLDDLDRLLAVLERRALEHRDTVMIGRTHGVHAEPTTFGFKLAGWIAELRRDRERLHGILSALAERLRSVYAAPGDERGKLAEKERLFAEARKSLEDALPLFQDKRYGRLLAQPWNNAFLASYLTYHQDLDLFDALLRAMGGDLRALVDCARGLRSAKDPFEQVRRWVEAGPDSACRSADSD